MRNTSSFNAAYNRARVHHESVLFSPQDIGPLPDEKAHVVVYRDGLAHAWFCSNPQEIVASRFDQIVQKVGALFRSSKDEALERTAANALRQVRELAPAEIRTVEGAIRDRVRAKIVRLVDREPIDDRTQFVVEDILTTREIARVGLGVDMVVAQPPA
jgi:hypothetical protein